MKLRSLCFYTCLSFCPQGGGVCFSACWDTTPPPRVGTPQEQAPRSRPPKSRPPLEQTPPGAGTLPEMATVADSTHPTGMHSCFHEYVWSVMQTISEICIRITTWKYFNLQECIPVGCIPSATVAILGGLLLGGGSALGGCLLWGCLLWGGACFGDACSWGVVSQHALRQTPPVDRMTDTCKNITFATSLQTVKS